MAPNSVLPAVTVPFLPQDGSVQIPDEEKSTAQLAAC